MSKLDVAERNGVYDYIKCVLILAVVIGHIASSQPIRLDDNILFKGIYSWHMYLFMALGGGIVGTYQSEFTMSWLKRRAQRLLIPYLVWTLIVMLLDGTLDSFGSVLMTLALYPVRWFLLTQFMYEAFLVIAFRWLYKLRYKFFAVLSFVALALYFGGIKFETLRHFALFAPFYYVGFYLSAEGKIKKMFASKRIFFVALLYPIAMLFYTYKDHGYFMEILQEITDNRYLLKFMDKVGFRIFNHCAVAPLGCVFYSVVTIKCANILEHIGGRVCEAVLTAIKFLGRHTMEIYLLHILVINTIAKYMSLNFGTYCMMFLMSIIIPVLCTFCMKKLPVLNTLLFGYKFPKKAASDK